MIEANVYIGVQGNNMTAENIIVTGNSNIPIAVTIIIE